MNEDCNRNESCTRTKYVYDADGQRVRKTVGGAVTDYLYDLAGHAITELNGSGAWMRGEIYAGGRHIATYANSTTYFNHADWLGTERARTAMNGTLCETITSLPFGDGMNTSGGCGDPSTHHFTGKMRDMETNLDYFGARYNSSSLGRFMSADWAAKPTSVPYAQFGDPQSLNLYSYVGNNPLSHDDVDGHCWPFCQVIAWIAIHVAQVGIGISSTRNEYKTRVAQATSPAERDALKIEMRGKGPALGRAMAENAANDPARIAARAAKSETELAESITRTSRSVNAIADTAGVVGKVAAPLAVGIAAYDVATSPKGERGRTAAGEVGGLGGALAGGEAGAEIGAAIGSFFGPGPGTAIGAGVGGVIGAIGTGYFGNKVATRVFDNVTKEPAQPN